MIKIIEVIISISSLFLLIKNGVSLGESLTVVLLMNISWTLSKLLETLKSEEKEEVG